MGKMISATEAAKRLGLDPSRIRILCRQRRIPRARLVGRTWIIPDDFEIAPPKGRAKR
jgi:hypothetical protein